MWLCRSQLSYKDITFFLWSMGTVWKPKPQHGNMLVTMVDWWTDLVWTARLILMMNDKTDDDDTSQQVVPINAQPTGDADVERGLTAQPSAQHIIKHITCTGQTQPDSDECRTTRGSTNNTRPYCPHTTNESTQHRAPNIARTLLTLTAWIVSISDQLKQSYHITTS
jgi:hypothetical protein